MQPDFNYASNMFPSYGVMFGCLCRLMCGESNPSSDYRKLAEDHSSLMETFDEVHIRELKRFIRSRDVTRNKALRDLVIITYDGSLHAREMMPLIEKMILYLISGENGIVYPKPSIPYDLLFDEYFNDTDSATLEDEIHGGSYRIRGELIDIIAKEYLSFDASPYADWSRIPSLTLDSNDIDPKKMATDAERLCYLKGSSEYLKSL